jgi:glycosyltransferase involved in cell wall biosynthesis
MTLRVGIYQHGDIPQSFKVYAQNVTQCLDGMNVEFIPFTCKKDLPTTSDVLWDIRSGGGAPPLEFMLNGPPLVMTVHGFAPITLSGWEYFRTVRGMMMTRQYAQEKKARWDALREGVAAVIAVSEFTKEEVIQYTGVQKWKVFVAPHGVDTAAFSKNPDPFHENYFFHVSNNEPRKNVHRIIAAFKRVYNTNPTARLVLKLPQNHLGKYQAIPGVEVIGGHLSTEALASLYQKALAFVFPSLYEGFGMPILEAMASGCPVITANTTACLETAGDAALYVNPRNENKIASAMLQLLEQPLDHERYAKAGFERVKNFTWLRSAQKHEMVLRLATTRCVAPHNSPQEKLASLI